MVDTYELVRLAMKFGFLLFVGSVIFSTAASAQVADCASFMKFGIYDHYNTLDETSRFEQFKQWLRQYEKSDYQTASTAANSVGIGSDAFSFDFHGKNAQSNWQEWVKEVEGATFEEVKQNDRFVQKIDSISPALMKLVGDCIHDMARGVQFSWIETSQNRAQLTFHLRYIPTGPGDQLRLVSIGTTPPRIFDNCPQFTQFARQRTPAAFDIAFTCAVNPRTTVSITLQTNRDAATDTLNGYVPTVRPHIVVVGPYKPAQVSDCLIVANTDPVKGLVVDVYGVPPGSFATLLAVPRGHGDGAPKPPGDTIPVNGQPKIIQNMGLVDDAQLILSVDGVSTPLATLTYAGAARCQNNELHFQPSIVTLVPR